MKKIMFLITLLSAAALAACGNAEATSTEARAVFEISGVYQDEQPIELAETDFEESTLTFVGPENGGNVLIRVGEATIQASINPSREHPSFETGYWHHHLYEGPTETGSPRINFLELLPELDIDENEDAVDNTQSAYQRGNLHYLVETGQYRLRFTINGVVTDLIFSKR